MNEKQAQELSNTGAAEERAKEREFSRRYGFISMVATICRGHAELARAIQSLAESGFTGSMDPQDYTRIEVAKATIKTALDTFDWWTRGVLNEEQQERAASFRDAVEAMGDYLRRPPKSIVAGSYWDFRNFFREVDDHGRAVARWILDGEVE